MPRPSRHRKELFEELTTAFRHYQRAIDAHDEAASALMGVNRTDARVLDLLQEHQRLSAGEIASVAGLSSGAVTGVLDRMERAGYLRRVADATDRRRVLVEATPKLHQTAQEIFGGIAARGDKLLSTYSDDELALMARAVRGVTEVTDEYAAELRARAPSRGSRA